MKLVTLLMTLTLFTSCSSKVKRSQRSGDLNVSVTSKLSVDVDVDTSKKIQGSVKHIKLFGFIDIKTSKHYADGVNYGQGESGFSLFGPGIVEEAKSAAAYKAVVPGKADVLVAPQYLVKVESYLLGAWKVVTAQVSGYAGTIKQIKKNSNQ